MSHSLSLVGPLGGRASSQLILAHFGDSVVTVSFPEKGAEGSKAGVTLSRCLSGRSPDRGQRLTSVVTVFAPTEESTGKHRFDPVSPVFKEMCQWLWGKGHLKSLSAVPELDRSLLVPGSTAFTFPGSRP